MSILDRYITRVVIQGTLLVLLVLCALFAFLEFVAESDDIGKFDYGLLEAMVFIILSLPRSIYELFPTAVLIGSLLSLGTLAANSELIVMRASGITVTRIIRSVVQTGLILALFIAAIGETLVPLSEQKAQSIRTAALHRNISLGNRNGLWVREGNLYLNVRQIYPNMQLGNIQIYEFDDQRRLKQITRARSGVYKDGEWQLKTINRSRFEGEKILYERKPQETWMQLFNPDLFNVVAVKPQDMSALDLYRYSEYLESNNLDASSYRLAFWIKIITPISSIVMLLIAMPFVFGSLRSGSAGQRVLIGILVGVGFYMINRTMNHMGQVYGIHPVISASLPVIVVMFMGIFALRRIR